MKGKQRLAGIDLCRGIAAFAVVLLHSGDQTWGPVAAGVLELRNFFFFAVPFFLATSFYFAIRKLYVAEVSYPLRSRLQRMLVPYALWSLLYLVSKLLIFSTFKDYDKLQKFLQDPTAIIFLGGASVQLYFLPLLLSGTLLLPLVDYLAKRQIGIKVLGCLFLFSIGLYQLLVVSGNSFQLGPNVAFEGLSSLILPDANKNPLLRVVFAVTAWAISCMPYISISMILNYLFTKTNFLGLVGRYGIFLLPIFVVANTFGSAVIPNSLNDLLRAYSLLLFAISLSKFLNESSIVANLGLCSFGIYLVHPLAINVVEVVLTKINPNFVSQVSVSSVLLFSIPSFLISWLVVALLIKKQWLAKYMFSA